jgi:uncharacterized membrane protein
VSLLVRSGAAWRCWCIGLASGARSTAGLTALVFAARAAGPDAGLPAALASRPALVASMLASTGEVIVDKLPQTPSRLAPGGIGARVVTGGAAGALLARSSSAGRGRGGASRGRGGASQVRGAAVDTGVGAVIGVVGALTGAWVGATVRARAARAGRPDWPTALAEDATSAVLAGLAVTARRG